MTELLVSTNRDRLEYTTRVVNSTVTIPNKTFTMMSTEDAYVIYIKTTPNKMIVVTPKSQFDRDRTYPI